MNFMIPALLMTMVASASASEPLMVGDAAPAFEVKTDEGKPFRMEDRRGKWTILFFYPKADTPGCTKQACSYRDSLKQVRDLGAEVFGVSADSVDDLVAFKKKHRLNFTLLSDADAKVIKAYGTKMPVLKMSKRWTFIVDPALRIRFIETDVDPVLDAGKMTTKLRELQALTE